MSDDDARAAEAQELLTDWLMLETVGTGLAMESRRLRSGDDAAGLRELAKRLREHTTAIGAFRTRLHGYHQRYGPLGRFARLPPDYAD